MRRHLRTPSFATVIACVALFAVLGGSSYAAVTVALAKNSKELGGKPASDYLLKSQAAGEYLQASKQSERSSGLVELQPGQSKTLFTLAGGNLVIKAQCVSAGTSGNDAEINATVNEVGVYWLETSVQVVKGATLPLVATGDNHGTEFNYESSDLTTPQGDYYFQETFGVNPGSGYDDTCVFDDRVFF